MNPDPMGNAYAALLIQKWLAEEFGVKDRVEDKDERHPRRNRATKALLTSIVVVGIAAMI